MGKYTQVNDIILDPFSGSGGIILGALKYKRRAIYNDLNPIAQIIAKANLIYKRSSIELQKNHMDLYIFDYKGEKHEVRYYIWEKDRVVGARLYGGQLIDLDAKDYDGEIIIVIKLTYKKSIFPTVYLS